VDPTLKAGLEAVIEHLRRDGLDARLGGDCAYLGLGDAAVVIPWSQIESTPDGSLHSAALGVALRPGEDQPPLFHDIISAFGASPEEAVVQTMLLWRHAELPPILPLIGGPMLPEVQRLAKDSEIYCPPWILYSGPYSFMESEEQTFAAHLQARPPLLMVRELLRREVDHNRLHWLKLYRFRSEDRDEADCFLDGVQFERGVSRLMEWPWPRVDGPHFFRQFLVLLPEERSCAELIAERLQTRRAIYEAVDLLGARTESDDDAIVAELVRRDVDEALAIKLVGFVPLAFGRIVLAEMEIQAQETYRHLLANGKLSRPHKLRDEPVFEDALAVARWEQKTGLGTDVFRAVAGRSCEVSAVSEALAKGVELDALQRAVFSETIVPWAESGTGPAKRRREKEGKRWWQLWK
jgi:hypothetical protein